MSQLDWSNFLQTPHHYHTNWFYTGKKNQGTVQTINFSTLSGSSSDSISFQPHDAYFSTWVQWHIVLIYIFMPMAESPNCKERTEENRAINTYKVDHDKVVLLPRSLWALRMEAGLQRWRARRRVWRLHLNTHTEYPKCRKCLCLYDPWKTSQSICCITVVTMGSFSSESRPRGANSANGRSRLAAVIYTHIQHTAKISVLLSIYFSFMT